MDGALVGSSLIKQLASCKKSSRDKALRILLKTWLPGQSQISDDDMKKLWKGLFYCFWHSDKTPVQAELADRLSSMLLCLDLPVSVHFFSVFFLTMRREWSGIDALRLDKFYLLIRRFLHNLFVLLRKNSWDPELSRRLVAVLFADHRDDLHPGGINGNGVSYHIASVFLEELGPFLPVGSETLEIIFEPFISVMGKLRDKVLIGKIKSNVFDMLVKMGRKLLELEVKKASDAGSVGDSDADKSVMLFGMIVVMMGLSSKFYELGSSPGCFQGNRKVLFALHEEFLKLEKELASSGIEMSVPDVKDGDEEEEVPNLIPIANVMEIEGGVGALESAEVVSDAVNGSAGKLLNKSGKAKKASGVTSGKKGKKKKDFISENGLSDAKNDSVVIAKIGENSNYEQNGDGNLIMFNETVISNLQKQFENVAAEVGLDSDEVASACDFPIVTVNGTVSKKRKRAKTIDGNNGTVSKKKKRVKTIDGQQSLQNPELTSQGDGDGSTTAKSGEKSAKKVRFSMKSNLVWKPHSPLPPQSLRIPPSVTPRGSALKKGVPPGPVREMPSEIKRVKRRPISVKGRKGIKSAVKRLKKLKPLSA